MTTPLPTNSPWFGISMALVGVIVGYGMAQMNGAPAPAKADPKPTAAAPAAPTPAAPTPAAPTAQNVDPVDPENDHIKGNPKAKIAVIEYSDFECPFCTRHHPTLENLVEQRDDVMWVYRHFPLGFHSSAQKAAEASECAGDQDKFWEYTDVIFEKGATGANWVAYAESIGLDSGDFSDCMDTDKYAQKVKDQMAKGSAAGVRGTPGNIVYNIETKEAKLVSGAQGIDAFNSAIDELL